jgi:hypothetical protein
MRTRRPRLGPVPQSAFAGFGFPPEVIVLAVRWYLRFGLSYRDLEELLTERGVEVDHVTVYRWVLRFTPLLAEAARPCRHAVGDRWSVDDEDVARLVGPRGRHNPDRAAVRHGTEQGTVTLGGRRVPVRRPRVRAADRTGELPVPSYQVFASTELLDQLTLERMLAKLSCRRYQAGLEPVGSSVEQTASATSKSAVSRRFVAATEHALGELLAADLTGLDLVAVMVDGIRVAEHCCVVALGVTLDGTKVPLGWPRAPPRTPRWWATCWSGCGSAG